MRIGIIGAGRIGGNAARRFAQAGHDVLLSFAREEARLRELAQAIGERARAGTPAEAAAFGDVLMLAVPWPAVADALAQAGSLDGKVVIDTTNPFGRGGWEVPEGETTAQLHQRRLPGAKVVKAFNTLTAGFQASAAGREGEDRVVLFLAGDEAEAKATVAALIRDAGFEPADLGSAADSTVMEAPRAPRRGVRRGVPRRRRSGGGRGRPRRAPDPAHSELLRGHRRP